MPANWSTYAEVAKRYGGVDPKDHAAVERFFTETLPTLSIDKQKKIVEELLGGSTVADSGPVKRDYPKGVPIPKLSEAKEFDLKSEWLTNVARLAAEEEKKDDDARHRS